jgi:molybdate transport repressor ModE-like protein
VRGQIEIEFRHVVVVHEIDRAGSIARAARRLGLSQPAASELLARLERYLGQPIFTRSGAGVAPTEFGRDFLASSQHLLPIFSDLLEDLASRRRVSDSTVRDQKLRFGGLPSAATTAIMAALLTHQRPAGVHLRQDLDSEQLFELLGQGRLEIAVVIDSANPDQLDLPPRISSQALGTGAWVAAVGPRHRFHDAPGVTFRDLKDEPWLLSTNLPGSAKTALLRACSAAGFLPQVIAEAEPSALRDLVAGGYGVCIDVASLPARPPGTIPLTGGPAPVRYLLVWRNQTVSPRELSNAVRAGERALTGEAASDAKSHEPLSGPAPILLSSENGALARAPIVA